MTFGKPTAEQRDRWQETQRAAALRYQTKRNDPASRSAVRREGEGKALERQTPLRARSKKMAAKMRVLAVEVAAFLLLHPLCARCGKPASCVHHRRGRIGDLLFDKRWWASSCAECNDFAETHTGQALAEGWLLPQFGLIPEDVAL